MRGSSLLSLLRDFRGRGATRRFRRTSPHMLQKVSNLQTVTSLPKTRHQKHRRQLRQSQETDARSMLWFIQVFTKASIFRMLPRLGIKRSIKSTCSNSQFTNCQHPKRCCQRSMFGQHCPGVPLCFRHGLSCFDSNPSRKL